MKGAVGHLAIGFIIFLFCLVISLNAGEIFGSFSESSRELLGYAFVGLGLFCFAVGYSKR